MPSSATIMPETRDRMLRFAPFAILILAGLIMAWNVAIFPSAGQYDAWAHKDMIDLNRSLTDFRVHIPETQLRTNPPYYWYVYGKISEAVRLLATTATGRGPDNMLVFRALHSIGLLLVVALYIAVLLPRLGTSPLLRLYFALGLLAIPNVYLAQVMVRADHLAFLMLSALLFQWFYFDLGNGLWTAHRRQVLLWAAALVALANTRHVMAPAVAVFFALALVRLQIERPVLTAGQKRLAAIVLPLVVVLASHHYIVNFIRTGHLFTEPLINDYYRHYDELSRSFDRGPMFANLEFSRLLEKPNRLVIFSTDALWPKLYADMWGDFWLYFSGPRLVDLKEMPKKLLLVAAAPFTLGYLATPLVYAVRMARSTLAKRFPSLAELAGLLFCLGFASLLVFIYLQPEPGKNSTAKFIYLYPYVMLPLLCMVDALAAHRRTAIAATIYVAVLAVLAIPIDIYWR